MIRTLPDEVAAGDAVERQGMTDPGTQPPGSVLVVAIAPHKADGVRYLPGQQYYLEKTRAEAGAARGLLHLWAAEDTAPPDWWTMQGRVLSPWPGDREEVFSRSASPGALKIVSGCGYDPGSQGYRFHSALNQHTKHAAVFVRWGDSNPFSSLRTLDGERDGHKVREAILAADVLHCHVNYLLLNNSGLQPQPGQLLVRHYHGSIRPAVQERLGVTSWVDPRWDASRRAVVVGARLTLLEEARQAGERDGVAVDMQWLPITVPVARYRQLSREKPTGGAYTPMSRRGGEPRPVAHTHGFRIAHAPTDQENKGTKRFLKVCDRLNQKGLSIIPVLMRDLPQGEAIARKATCDATFDSFWLGIQTSGIEAGALQQPCIAGDADVARLYRDKIGHVPYTFAGDEAELEAVIERLVVDRDYYTAEAARVSAYVEEWHDYPAVARIYEGILARALGRDDVHTVGESGLRVSAAQAERDRPDNGGHNKKRRRGRAA